MKWKLEWNALLGKECDRALAVRLGVNPRTVTEHRSAMGIAAHGREKIDRAGLRFGKWTIGRELRRTGKAKNPVYECRCDCGQRGEIPYNNLRSGASSQCRGCQYEAQAKFRVGVLVNGQRIVAVKQDSVILLCESCGFKRRHGFEGMIHVGCRRCAQKGRTDRYGHRYELNGEEHNLSGWARRIGITREGMRQRILRLPLAEALTKPRAA